MLKKGISIRWLEWHGNRLLESLEIGGFNFDDVETFKTQEQAFCQGNEFCEAGYRQEAIYLMLGGG